MEDVNSPRQSKVSKGKFKSSASTHAILCLGFGLHGGFNSRCLCRLKPYFSTICELTALRHTP
jgi:hypothetical protein